jgi:hypothetical protein
MKKKIVYLVYYKIYKIGPERGIFFVLAAFDLSILSPPLSL